VNITAKGAVFRELNKAAGRAAARSGIMKEKGAIV
jgi:hypothetical protein